MATGYSHKNKTVAFNSESNGFIFLNRQTLFAQSPVLQTTDEHKDHKSLLILCSVKWY
ncbi:hypothetical protein HMPREF9509_00809 [Enterococcus faecalis TX0411]|nr:hypothetical protein HMPREF9509_00809 [Enterococcus faecalis TX0411]